MDHCKSTCFSDAETDIRPAKFYNPGSVLRDPDTLRCSIAFNHSVPTRGLATVRIIAGQYRRRKLLANTGLTTRPITDRAKEQLFENLGGELHGERVADIFSGTGSLGLEALSRGASSVLCIERDRRGFELLKQNVETLGVAEQVFCWKADVFRCSFQPKGVSGYLPFDLIFFDPPFPLLKKLKAGSPMYASLERLARGTVSSPDVLMIVRAPTRAEYEMPPDWRLDWTLPLSSMEMHCYRKTELPPQPDAAESE